MATARSGCATASVLMPKDKNSKKSVADAEGHGSEERDSPYIHTTTDVVIAAFFAQQGEDGRSHRRPRYVVVIDRRRLEERGTRLIDLTTTEGRSTNGIEPGVEGGGGGVGGERDAHDIDAMTVG